MQFKCNQLFRPGPLDQMKNGKFDRLELQNFSPLLSKQNLKNGRKMESSLTDFIGEEYVRNVFLKPIGYSKDNISIFWNSMLHTLSTSDTVSPWSAADLYPEVEVRPDIWST